MAVYRETIQLDDEVSAPAKAAATVISALSKSAIVAEGALSKVSGATIPVGNAMGGLAGKTFDAANAMQVGKETISAAVAGMRAAFSSLAAGDVKGAIAGVTDAVSGMAKMLDLVVPGLGEAVSLVVTIAGGLVGVTAGLIKSGAAFAIEATTAKIQMLSMFDALGQGKISGEEVDDMLDDLSSRLGQTKDAMVPLVKAFATMGITGKEALEKMTTAALSAQALGGTSEAFVDLQKKIQAADESGGKLKIKFAALAGVGLHVEDVAAKMGISAKTLGDQMKAGSVDAKKFGDAMTSALLEKGAGPLETMGLSVKNLGGLLQQYIGDMFEDLRDPVMGFLTVVKDLFGIFDSKSKPSGQALKAGIEGFFKQVLVLATKVVPLVKHFLLDMIIFGLKAYIAMKPIVKTMIDMWKQHDGMGILMKAFEGIKLALIILGGVIAFVVGLFLGVIAVAVLVSVAFWTLLSTVMSFTADASKAIGDWVVGATAAAADFIKGLVDGISKGATDVVNAVKGVASSAVGAFEGALGIQSPSKVMMDLGGHTSAGFAQGIEDGGEDVHGAASGVAGQAVKGAGAPAASSGSGSSGASGGVVMNVNVQIDGAGKSAEAITDEMVSQVFQRYALAAGL